MRNYKRIIAAVLAVAVSAAATGSIAYAKSGSKSEEAGESSAKSASEDKSARAASDSAAYKDETVYVLCNTDSSVKNVVVSDWLKNAPALSSISDISDLEDIVNVKGNEEFAQNGESLDWTANGSDIYYKGTTNKELPADVNITYYLDGREIAPADLAGKSGHVTIRWDYKNKQKVTKEINGKKTEIYVPFMAASA